SVSTCLTTSAVVKLSSFPPRRSSDLLVFLAAVVLHLCRIFFTGAFRKPRELNWMVGVTLLILAIVNGFAGYSLLDDLLSGTGVRDRKSTRLNSSHVSISYAVFCLKKK